MLHIIYFLEDLDTLEILERQESMAVVFNRFLSDIAMRDVW